MNYLNPTSKSDSSELRGDRDLLVELGLNDAAAASYLGKSRQVLNMQLGAKRSTEVRNPYFKLSEILVLVMAAQARRHQFNAETVWRFIEETAADRPGGSEDTYELLRQRLRGVEEVDLTEAGTAVMILPAFADMRQHLPDFCADLRRVAASLESDHPRAKIAILSSSRMQAAMAADWLRPAGSGIVCFAHENVDYFVPTVLVFPRSGADPRPYALNERGTLGAAPQFRAHAMGEYVKFLLPPEAREELFTYELEPADSDDEVKPRKRA